ncbi:MAG TPA: hypothetical protein VJ957_11385 [Longimicrobiales bacterium]|nr:hypothetical protein [Longimicrobiales bacterium]
MAQRRAVLPFIVMSVSSLLAACGGGGSGSTLTRADSAGVEIVTSGAKDVVLDWRFEPRFTLGGADSGPQSFYRVWPGSVGADSAGWLYVLDSEAKRVVVFGPDGSYLRAMGHEGGGPGELKMSYWLDVAPDGAASVFDFGKMSAVRWGPAGAVLPELRTPLPQTSSERLMAVTGDDDFYMTTPGNLSAGDDRSMRLIHVVDGDTTVLAELPQPNAGMHMFESCHVGLSLPPLFTPTVLWDTRAGLLAVVDGTRYAVDVYRDGTRVRSVRRALPPVEATDALAAKEVGDGLTIGIPGQGRCTIPPDEVVAARGYADVVPAVRRIGLAYDGSLWVQRWVPGASDAKDAPIDVFDATGAYVGTLPEGTAFPAVFLPGGGVGVVSEDSLEVQRLVVESVVRGAGAG